MNKFCTLLCFVLLAQLTRANPAADTVIQKVKVSFKFDNSIFPDSWQIAPVTASGEALDSTEEARCKAIAIKALVKYPTPILVMNLKSIYFIRSVKFYGVDFGATNDKNSLFITDDGKSKGYTDHFIEQSIHHEFSSILFRNYGWLLDTTQWKKANAEDVSYTDAEGGVGAIRKKEASQELDTALAQKGFLTQYAQSDVENDINTIAQNLFTPAPGFWKLVDAYPRIRQKVNMLIKFYHSILVTFTESYFRNFEKEKA